MTDDKIRYQGARPMSDYASELERKYLQVLEEIEAWKSASGLIGSSGDPDGVTPEHARKHWEAVERERDEMGEVLGRLVTWTTVYGADLRPEIGYHDTFGEGVRMAKHQVGRLLAGSNKRRDHE